MNYFITSILTVYFLLTSIFNVPFQEIEDAFSKGDAVSLVALGAPKILISIEGTEGVHSKSQGTQILSNFFKTYPPKSFKFTFKGKNEGATSFAVGTYTSTNGKFRVSIKFKKFGESHKIESITVNAVSE